MIGRAARDTRRNNMLIPLRVVPTKWGLCMRKVGDLCTQSGEFEAHTPRGTKRIPLGVVHSYPRGSAEQSSNPPIHQ